MRRLRERTRESSSTSATSKPPSSIQFFGTSSTISSSSSSSQPGGEIDATHHSHQLLYGDREPQGDRSFEARRIRELEERLREKEVEVETLTRQLREAEVFSGGVVRRTEPLFSPKNVAIDRPSSPASVASSQSSVFTSPVSTPRKFVTDFNTTSSGGGGPSQSPATFRVVSPPPFPTPPPPQTPQMTSRPSSGSLRMGSPPPLSHSKSYNNPNNTRGGGEIKRSASTGEISSVFGTISSPQQPHQQHQPGPPYHHPQGGYPPSGMGTSPPPHPHLPSMGMGSPPPLKKMPPSSGARMVVPTMTTTPPQLQQQQQTQLQREEEARRGRNQRMWDSIEKGLDSFGPDEAT